MDRIWYILWVKGREEDAWKHIFSFCWLLLMMRISFEIKSISGLYEMYRITHLGDGGDEEAFKFMSVLLSTKVQSG